MHILPEFRIAHNYKITTMKKYRVYHTNELQQHLYQSADTRLWHESNAKCNKA